MNWHEYSKSSPLDNEAPAHDAELCQYLQPCRVSIGPCVLEVDLQGHNPPSVTQPSALYVDETPSCNCLTGKHKAEQRCTGQRSVDLLPEEQGQNG